MTWRGMMVVWKNLSSCLQSCTGFWENPASHSKTLHLQPVWSVCIVLWGTNRLGLTLSGQLQETGQKETGHEQFTLPELLIYWGKKKKNISLHCPLCFPMAKTLHYILLLAFTSTGWIYTDMELFLTWHCELSYSTMKIWLYTCAIQG